MRKLIAAALFWTAAAFAGDPFMGTWKINIDCTIKATPSFQALADQIRARGLGSINAQTGGMGETVRIEPNGSGIKLTVSLGNWSNWLTTDFSGGETNLRDDSGKVLGRVRLTRKSANEIEAVFLGSGPGRALWRVSPDGQSLKFEATLEDGYKLAACYDRVK